MATEFYNVKKRKKVTVDESAITKVTYERKTSSGDTQIRYAVKAVDDDGTNLTKFCSKTDWDTISAPIK
jgi:hypothetical protein